MPNKENRGTKLTDQLDIRPSQNLQRKHGMQWSNEQITVECTMKAVLDNGVSANKAAILHGVPRSTLQVCLNGRVIHGRKPGPQLYLDAEKELIEASDIRDTVNLARMSWVLKERYCVTVKSCRYPWLVAKVLKRNLTLSLRVGDTKASIGMDTINADNLKNYFDQLRYIF